jgi:hypothetical protein
MRNLFICILFLILTFSLFANVSGDLLEKAQSGDSESQFQLAKVLDAGIGVEPDPPKAAEWYYKAAVQGHADAAEFLATLYEEGIGVDKDPILGAEWKSFAGKVRRNPGDILSTNRPDFNNTDFVPKAHIPNSIDEIERKIAELQKLKERRFRQNQNRQPIAFLPTKIQPPLKLGPGDISFVSVTKDNAKIYENFSRDSKVIGSAEWMSPYVVIEIKYDGIMQMLKVGNWINSDSAEVVGWIRKRDLLTKTKALKSRGVFSKAFPVTRFDDKEEKVEGAKLYPEPSIEATPIGQELTQFGIYYVFDEFDDIASGSQYYLMGRESSIWDPLKPEGTILGWVHARKMHRWDTREAAEYDKSTVNERKPTVIYKTEGDIKKIIMGATAKEVGHLFKENPNVKEQKYTDQRYPIINTSRSYKGVRYWQVAFIAEGSRSTYLSENKLRRLVDVSPGLDVLFVIDGSGRMTLAKEQIIETVRSIQEELIDYWQGNFRGEQEPLLRFSIAMYKDYQEDDFYRRTPLERRNVKEIAEFLNAHVFSGGFSKPAVFHGVSNAVKDASSELNSGSFRSVFLLGNLGNMGISNEPDKYGHTTSSLVRILKSNNMDFHAIHLGSERFVNSQTPVNEQIAFLKFRQQAELITSNFPEGMSSYIALSNPKKVTDHIKEKVTSILGQRYRTIREIIDVATTGKAIGNTLIEREAVKLMHQNGIDPSEFARKKISPFAEGWVLPFDLKTGKRQMKSVILMEKREVENLLAVLGRLTTIKAENAGKGWRQALEEVAGDGIKIGVHNSPADLFRKYLGIKVKSGILSKSFDEIANLPQAEVAEAVKDFQKKLLMLRGVVNEKDIKISIDPKTGRPDYYVAGDKQYWFGHRGALHVWLDRDIFIP